MLMERSMTMVVARIYDGAYDVVAARALRHRPRADRRAERRLQEAASLVMLKAKFASKFRDVVHATRGEDTGATSPTPAATPARSRPTRPVPR